MSKMAILSMPIQEYVFFCVQVILKIAAMYIIYFFSMGMINIHTLMRNANNLVKPRTLIINIIKDT